MSRGANVRIQMICYQKQCKQTVEWHLSNNERGKKNLSNYNSILSKSKSMDLH